STSAPSASVPACSRAPASSAISCPLEVIRPRSRGPPQPGGPWERKGSSCPRGRPLRVDFITVHTACSNRHSPAAPESYCPIDHDPQLPETRVRPVPTQPEENLVKSIKRTLGLAGAGILTLAACGTAPAEGDGEGGADGASADFKTCMVSDSGGWDDKSFNESSYDGLMNSVDEHGIDHATAESTTDSDF